MTVSVIMPVYNEEKRVEEAILKTLAQPCVSQLIIVDDGSTDLTPHLLEKISHVDSRIKTDHHEKNLGKGAAIRTGLTHVSSEIVVIQDADLEYDPAEYPRFLKPIFDDNADVVFGSRFLGSEAHRALYFWNYQANRFLTMISNMLSNLNLTDMETGMKAFRREIFDHITLEENRFGFEPEITAKVARKKYRIYEVAIPYHGRTYAEGKKIRWHDAPAALWFILKHNLLS